MSDAYLRCQSAVDPPFSTASYEYAFLSTVGGILIEIKINPKHSTKGVEVLFTFSVAFV